MNRVGLIAHIFDIDQELLSEAIYGYCNCEEDSDCSDGCPKKKDDCESYCPHSKTYWVYPLTYEEFNDMRDQWNFILDTYQLGLAEGYLNGVRRYAKKEEETNGQ